MAEIARGMGALTLSVVTIPFQVERARLAKAKEGLRRLIDWRQSHIEEVEYRRKKAERKS